MATQYDRSCKDTTFKVGDLVYLDASDLKKPPGLAHKLLLHFHGPFKILECLLPLNYHLDLPPKSCAHDIFHVKKLLPAYGHNQNLFRMADKPVLNDEPVTDDLGDYYKEEYEVKKLLAHHYDSKGNLQYKVHWFKFSKDHDSWQTLKDLASTPETIQDFWQSLSYAAQTKHDAVLKRMVDSAPDGSLLKSGNVIEMVISDALAHTNEKI